MGAGILFLPLQALIGGLMESKVVVGMNLRWQIPAQEFQRIFAYASTEVITSKRRHFERNRLHEYPSR